MTEDSGNQVGLLDDRLSELKKSGELLSELLDIVQANEGTLTGGQKLGVGAEAIESLRQCAITFGNPADNLVRLTPELFASVGANLNAVWRAQMESGTAFYYLTLTISLRPGGRSSFDALECIMDFGPKGSQEPIIQAVFPASQWRELLRSEVGMSVAIDTDLKWAIGAAIPTHLGRAEAKASAGTGIHGVLVAGNYIFQLGHADVSATGEGNSTCYWKLANPEVRQVQTITFAAIFKLPATVTNVSLRALCAARPSTAWLVRSLRHIWWGISDHMRRVLSKSEASSRGLVVGDHETWNLELPA